ncbi:MAG: hypothetical protein ABSC02_08285 [Acidobacteriota bacterium]|jgi:hypothetical protein
MPNLDAISAEGVRAAYRTLDQAAQDIAAGSVNARRDPAARPGTQSVSGVKSQEEDSYSGTPDLAAKLYEVDQATVAAKTNLRVLSVERQLDHDTLDLLA